MKTKESTQQLFLSLGLKPIILPIGIQVWQISHSQANFLQGQLGNPSQTEAIKYYGSKYSWLPDGPVTFLIPDYWGLAFRCEAEAKLVITRVRQRGCSEESSRWFLTMTGGEARETLANTSHKVFPNRKEGTVYELMDGTMGYLDCWSYCRVHWFPTLEDYHRYETNHLELMASL